MLRRRLFGALWRADVPSAEDVGSSTGYRIAPTALVSREIPANRKHAKKKRPEIRALRIRSIHNERSAHSRRRAPPPTRRPPPVSARVISSQGKTNSRALAARCPRKADVSTDRAKRFMSMSMPLRSPTGQVPTSRNPEGNSRTRSSPYFSGAFAMSNRPCRRKLIVSLIAFRFFMR